MGKRSNGEGNIRKQQNGTWRAELMVGYTDEGKRNSRSSQDIRPSSKKAVQKERRER